MLGWTVITRCGSHLRSSRMAPCLSNGRLPSLADANELRDVEIECKGGVRRSTRGEIAVDNRRAEMNHLRRGVKGFQLRSERSLELNGNDNGSSLTEEGFQSTARRLS